MTRLTRLTAILLLLPAMVAAKEQSGILSHRINYGLKVGCASTTLIMRDIRIGDFSTDEYSPNSETGFIVSAFGKVNLGRCYLQTGLSFYSCYSSVDFQYKAPESETETEQTFSIQGKYLQVPLLFGFNLVKEDPYSLSLFAGPKLTLPLSNTFSSEYSGFRGAVIDETIYPVTLKITLGMCCSIKNVLMDFGYDIELRPQSDGVLTESTFRGVPGPVVMRRSTGVLYFSLGFIF